ncbi:MAG: hypothetical protein V4619_13780 [Bacteroidota bacterium]
MESIVINPKTKDEAKFIADLLERMNISSKVISDEEKEDMGLLLMMKEADLNDRVSRDEVMKKLAS